MGLGLDRDRNSVWVGTRARRGGKDPTPQIVDKVGGAMMGWSTMTRIAGTFWAVLRVLLTFKGYA
jgi:hypothetical protein